MALRFDFTVLLVVSLLAFVAYGFTNEERCADIGVSSGCSGCNNINSGCTWCTNRVDESYHPSEACAPLGSCGDLEEVDMTAWKERANICPDDPYKEHKLMGSTIPQAQQELFTKGFDSHYCDFPDIPWAVDRFVNIKGDFNPAGYCHMVNNRLFLGQRKNIEDECDVDLDDYRTQQCLRAFQSLQCTTACPEYGEDSRHQRLCYDECAQIEQLCGGVEDFLDCLTNIAMARGGGVFYECEAKGQDDCYTPKRIEASGQFDYDYCFNTKNKEHCKETDCVLEVVDGGDFGSYWADNCPCCDQQKQGYNGYNKLYDSQNQYTGSDGTQRTTTCGGAAARGAMDLSPACIYSDWRSTPGPYTHLDKIAVALKILVEPSLGGASCEEVGKRVVSSYYEDGVFGEISVTCAKSATIPCIATFESYPLYHPSLCGNDIGFNCQVPDQAMCQHVQNHKKTEFYT